MRRSVSNFQRGRLEDTCVFPEIILGIEFDIHGGAGGGAPGNQEGLGKFGGATQMSFTGLRSHGGIEIEQAAEARGRIKESGGCEIQTLNVELGVHRGKRGVLLIERANLTVELEGPASGKTCRERHGKLRGRRNVGGGEVHLVIDAALLGASGADVDASVFEGQLVNRELIARRGTTRRLRWRRGCGGRLRGLRFSGGSTEGGIIPFAMRIADERDFRAVDRDAGDVDLLGKNQRNQLDAHSNGLGGEEWRLAELGIVSNGEIVRSDGAREERETQIADVDLASQCGRSFFFNGRTKLINGNQKGSHDNEYDE